MSDLTLNQTDKKHNETDRERLTNGWFAVEFFASVL